MGTPKGSLSPKLVDIIQNPPKTDEDWLRMVENLLESIQPNLRDMTLKRVHNVACVDGNGSLDDFSRVLPAPVFIDTEGKKIDSDIRGLFHWAGSKTTVKYGEARHNRFGGLLSYPDGHTMVWGLQRDGAWVSITVIFKGEVRHPDSEKPWKDFGYKKVYEVRVAEVELDEMCRLVSVHPKEVYVKLISNIEEWLENRNRLLGYAKRIYDFTSLEVGALLAVNALSQNDLNQ